MSSFRRVSIALRNRSLPDLPEYRAGATRPRLPALPSPREARGGRVYQRLSAHWDFPLRETLPVLRCKRPCAHGILIGWWDFI